MNMSIKVRYFASLKEQLGRSDETLPAVGIASVRQVWTAANPQQPLPDNILAAVNMDYADLDSPVRAGDEVAFFPPVTGG
ncbi:MoaD/ThiS family protein [Methylovulum psychrotolerans]|uniref:Molybdopterin synthase sulfur carrier subunit n=2 Tax=Methylovulum psychrotolerans TaxID=1704499 RepID=A0A2S5CSH7_9GAMM|nr:MoaD/ThiS family protein [Methylovulum psychrotolerans]